jgi:hypothetical protein
MTFGEVSRKLTKIINKNKTRLKIGTNVSNELNCSLKLKTEQKEIIEITQYTSEMIEKIAF